MLGKDEIKRIDPNEHVCVIIWSVVDVIDRAKERHIKATRQEAEDIIDRMEDNHDVSLGITWDTIDCYLDEIKEEREEERKAKKAKQKVEFT